MTQLLGVGRDATARESLGLIWMVGVIARHPEFPGKRDAADECGQEIENRFRQGRLTPAQRAELLGILSGGRRPAMA